MIFMLHVYTTYSVPRYLLMSVSKKYVLQLFCLFHGEALKFLTVVLFRPTSN